MRHKVAGNRLGRNSTLRKATIRDIAKATLIRQRICTTRARAKEARKLVDRLITLGKKGQLHHKRIAFSILGDHRLVSDLFQKIATRFQQRKGGYTRIIAISSPRRGDDARLVYLELTEKDRIIISNVKIGRSKSKEAQAHSHEKPVEGAPKLTQATEEAAQNVKEEKPRRSAPVKKENVPDKGQGKKNIVGGIKKMFQRKTGAE
ncbi:MAG: 50S ribosomal protein L17 [Candidatus Omnitrophica bacterium]|nr:50S ribosomal protein L17 [Candidatus Omnitrophota bacterium]